ncbi:MAG TPA: hypothetical protein VHO84_06185 [Syntrophorhabdaceae bacterium]|nr:hypothetical protein [Syntrophorhabdaceae bacterium]
MKTLIVSALVTMLALGMAVPSVYSMDDGESYKASGKGDAILFDLIFLRPLGIISCGVGFATTLVGAPFIVGRDNARDVGDALLNEPGNYTFWRPLGQID